jgi:hypothetical protein
VSAVILLLGISVPVSAQEGQEESQVGHQPVPAEEVPIDPYAARTPFGPGEHLTYNVKVGIFGVGESYMTVHQVDTLRGNPTYRVVFGLEGGLLGLNVDDEHSAWMDIYTLQSWRYVRDIHEVNYHSYREYDFYPERREWERENGDTGPLASSIPLDEVSFIYYARTLPLEVGKSYTLNRYFEESGNPVVIEVLRKDRRETEAGVFNTIVVRPVIQTDGLFSEGGEAELHFTDDERRILVYMKADIPNFPGSLTLHLRSIEEGTPVNPESRAEVLEARAARTQAATVPVPR